MQNIKIGDIVICIVQDCEWRHISCFREYEVYAVSGKSLYVENDNGQKGWYSKNNFKLKPVADKIDVGDVVVCINDDGIYSPFLVKGNEYIVLEKRKNADTVRLQGNNSCFYSISRFIPKEAYGYTLWKKGDTLCCTREGTCRLTQGFIYTIQDIKGTIVQLEGDPLWYHVQRFKLNKSMEKAKKVTRWKLMRPEYQQAVKELLGIPGSNMLIDAIPVNDTVAINKLKKAGVLELWFEPQYEAEVKEVRVGDNSVLVEIREGSPTITLVGMKGSFEISQLEKVIQWASGKDILSSLGSWNIRLSLINETQRCFKLGCEDSTYFFSLWEMRLIKSEWDQLNS